MVEWRGSAAACWAEAQQESQQGGLALSRAVYIANIVAYNRVYIFVSCCAFMFPG